MWQHVISRPIIILGYPKHYFGSFCLLRVTQVDLMSVFPISEDRKLGRWLAEKIIDDGIGWHMGNCVPECEVCRLARVNLEQNGTGYSIIHAPPALQNTFGGRWHMLIYMECYCYYSIGESQSPATRPSGSEARRRAVWAIFGDQSQNILGFKMFA